MLRFNVDHILEVFMGVTVLTLTGVSIARKNKLEETIQNRELYRNLYLNEYFSNLDNIAELDILRKENDKLIRQRKLSDRARTDYHIQDKEIVEGK